jgi:hypothetical protein
VKRALLFVAGAVALAAPAAAAAKNISSVKLCGASDCATITNRDVLQRWMESGGSLTAPPAISRYYRLEITVSAAPGETFDNGKTSITWSEWYVPATQAIRGTDEAGNASWSRQSGRAAAIFADAVRTVEPYPAPTITAATIGGRSVKDPASYARLFDPGWKIATDWSAKDWRKIRLRSDASSPWTDGKNNLSYSPKKHVLMRDGTVVQVPRSVAARLTSARSLDADNGHRRIALAAAGIVAAALAGAAFLRRRSS